MHPDLKQLIRLQEVDLRVAEARRLQTAIPETQRALDVKLEGARAEVAAAREHLAANQTDRRALEKDLSAIQTRLSRYKDQLMEVKTNREYHAMQHEIETAQGEVQRLEDQMLELMVAGDEVAAGLKAAEAGVKQAEQQVTKEHAELDTQLAETATALERLLEEREAVIADIPPQAVALYEQVARARRGVAVAPARDGPVHGVSRPAAADGVHRSAAQQRAGPVRQLPAHPLLRPARRGGCGIAGMITAYIDGGSRGNPGPAGYGVQIVADDGAVVDELRQFVGDTTNNVAEYRGLIAALTWAVDRGLRSLHVRSDSELLVKQLRGEYRVKNAGLQPLYHDARTLVNPHRPGHLRARAPGAQHGSRPPGEPRDGRSSAAGPGRVRDSPFRRSVRGGSLAGSEGGRCGCNRPSAPRPGRPCDRRRTSRGDTPSRGPTRTRCRAPRRPAEADPGSPSRDSRNSSPSRETNHRSAATGQRSAKASRTSRPTR